MVSINYIGKVVEIKWDIEGEDGVKGTTCSLQVEGQEKRSVKNDGLSNLFFPNDFSGAVKVTVRGSRSGQDKGTIQVPYILSFNRILDTPYDFLVSPAQHPKGKGGAYACDINVHPGQPVYAPCDGTAAHFYPDWMDGGPVGGAFFNFKFPPEKKGDPADKFYFGHVFPATPDKRKYKKGEVLGTCSTTFLHVGTNHKATLDGLLS